MIEGVAIEVQSADDSLAMVVLVPLLCHPLPKGATLHATLRGPYSEGSRTLPTEFHAGPASDPTLTVSIIDPCYSTPDLSMEYEIELKAELAGQVLGTYHGRIRMATKSRTS